MIVSVRKSLATQVALPYIVRLRYLMAAWQFARMGAAAHVFHVRLELAWVVTPPAVILLSNILLSIWLATAGGKQSDAKLAEKMVAGVMVVDTLCFTVSLMLTGGPDNPYSMLYFVYIAISAVVLPRWYARTLGAFACVCYASVFVLYRPMPELERLSGSPSPIHLVGMWMAFVTATFLVTVFSGRISEVLAEREESLLRLSQELERKDRLASLVTLAAGAAHELNTPLGTIAIVARELERYATLTEVNRTIAMDSNLIRSEVDRCQEILRRMSVEGADHGGEPAEAISASSFLMQLRDSLTPQQRKRVVIQAPAAAMVLVIPRHSIEQALTSLIRNALDASPANEPVLVSVSLWHSGRGMEGRIASFAVRDHGCGMSEESLWRAGEPFYTTKEPGKGMGLGIFLVRALADRLGGHLALESSSEGTVATLEIPQTYVHEEIAV